MKKIKFLAFALTAFLTTSCMDGGYGAMDEATTYSSYGNDTITERNVITLEQLRNMPEYKTELTSTRSAKLVDKDIQLKLRVSGNDIGGNVYNKVALQDENGEAILACVYAGGIYAYLPVGQEVLINLKGLYVGTYGKQRQIGVPYTTSSGNTYAGRMPNYMWQQHIKLIGEPDPKADNIKPIEFTQSVADNIDLYAGRLMVMKNITMIDGKNNDKWAPAASNVVEDEENTEFSVSRRTINWPTNIFVYTSTSAKFANDSIPSGKINVTGIFSRYGDDWQILMRDRNDYEVAE